MTSVPVSFPFGPPMLVGGGPQRLQCPCPITADHAIRIPLTDPKGIPCCLHEPIVLILLDILKESLRHLFLLFPLQPLLLTESEGILCRAFPSIFVIPSGILKINNWGRSALFPWSTIYTRWPWLALWSRSTRGSICPWRSNLPFSSRCPRRTCIPWCPRCPCRPRRPCGSIRSWRPWRPSSAAISAPAPPGFVKSLQRRQLVLSVRSTICHFHVLSTPVLKKVNRDAMVACG
mmetsp:Transcript_44856/g.70239  ORF Transcript_44856/g.70239 Transcript_44856/m.70239 type:complete len:233 (+) Transcript_44856:1572-2270(+)